MITREKRINSAAELRVVKRETDDGGEPIQLVGYASTTGEWYEIGDWGRERVAPGAFAERLKDDVRSLFNHDKNYVLGRTRSGTLELEEDDTGLLSRTMIPDVSWVRDLVVAPIERGDISQMSFAFSVNWDDDVEFDEDEDGVLEWTINRFTKLWDVSPVTFPANEGTSISARCREYVEARRKVITRAATDILAARERMIDAALLPR